MVGLKISRRGKLVAYMLMPALLRYLPLLLVPPAVGVMVYAKDIVADFWAIVGALVLSLVIAMGFVGVLMQQMVKRKEKDQ